MIQRIQTLYLMLAFLISGIGIFLAPIWTLGTSETQKIIELFNASSFSLKLIPSLFMVSTLLMLITIFNYKNRLRQFIYGRLVIFMNFITLGILIYFAQNFSEKIVVTQKEIGLFLPILIIFLVVLANRAIKKDEDLIRSADRLR